MELNNIALVIKVGSQIWLVTDNGLWLEGNSENLIQLATLTIPQFTVGAEQIVFSNNKASLELQDKIIDIPENALLSLAKSLSLSQFFSAVNDSQNQAINNSNLNQTGTQGDNYFFQVIKAVNDEVIAKSGFDTQGADDTPSNVNYNQQGTNLAPPEASITIIDGGDGFLNRVEVPAVSVFGSAEGLPNDYLLSIVIVDTDGNEIFLNAAVKDEAFRLDNIDISSLSDGEVVAKVALNPQTLSTSNNVDSSVKDTLAEINVEVTSVCSNDGERFSISGTVKGINDGQNVTLLISDIAGTMITETVMIENSQYILTNLDTSGFIDGPLQVLVNSEDIPANTATNSTIFELDTLAQITINIDKTVDDTLNQLEDDKVTISGTAEGIENNQPITVVIVDEDNNQVSVVAVVNNNQWIVDNVNLSSLNNGQLQATATTEDLHCNIAEASDSVLHDKLASVSLDVTAHCSENGQLFTFTGHVTNVEDNNVVTLLFVDSLGNELSFDTTVVASLWTIEDLDLSTLADGQVSAIVSTTDNAGNIAENSKTIDLDILADITVDIDTGADQVINKFESTHTSISGVVDDIENGQPVLITLFDQFGGILEFTTEVVEQSWSLENIDISSLKDGNLLLTASAIDLSCNQAFDETTFLKDTQGIAYIDIDTSNGFNVADFRAGTLTFISGTTDAEVGSIVTLDLYSTTNDAEDGRTQALGSVVSEGIWLVDNININSLSIDGVWNLTASVTDNAGNFAFDEMPQLDVIKQQILYELVLDISESTSASSLFDVDNATLSLANVQTALANLTSVSNPVKVSVANDQQSLKVFQLASTESLAMEVALVGKELTVTTYLAFDEPLESEFLLTQVIVEATQIDDDGTSEVVQVPLEIKIFDTPPFLYDDQYTLTEAASHQGSFLGNDFTIEGPLEVTKVTFEGSIFIIPTGGEVALNTGYGVLSVNSIGAWSFTANTDIDNSENHEFTLSYQAIDKDGSINNANATFTIVDGVPGQVINQKVTLNEPDYNKVSVDSIDIDILAGSDNLVADTATFSASTVDAIEGLGLTSGGVAIVYTLSVDNKKLIASSNGETIFSLDLTATENGRDLTATVIINQQGPIDNLYTDSITLPLTIEANDLDGTAVTSGALLFTSLDGDNPYIEDISGVSLSEGDLTIGSSVTKTGALSSFIGSDRLDSVLFSDINQQPELTSDGQNIQYELQPNDGRPDKILIAHTGDINDPVFKVQLTSNFSDTDDTIEEPYTFTLYRSFDQGVTEDVKIAIELSDFDGDVENQSLNIRILDDGEASITTPELLVTEIPRVLGSSITNTAVGNVEITANADRIIDIDYDITNGDAVLDTNGQALTHNGEAITWSNVGAGKLFGQLSDGTKVIRVKLPSDIDIESAQATSVEVKVTLRDSIDHLGSQDNQLTLAIPVVLIDQDGSRFVDVMQVRVDDGLNPSLPSSVSGDNNVDEHGLLNKGTINTNGNITLESGSDDIASITLADDFNLSGISTRGGESVSLNNTANSKGWFIAKADDTGQEVFRIKFNVDGSFEYIQRQAIDHANGDGTNHLIISFQVQAIDSDGDKSSAQTVNVTVVDDIPAADAQVITIVEGQTGTLDIFDDQQGGADGASLSKITYSGSDYFVGDTITLLDTSQSTSYGFATFTSDGIITFTTKKYSSTAPSFDDDAFIYEITDADGDIATESIVVTIKDSEGGVIFAPLVTNEDDPLNLIFAAGLGDADEGEYINELRINIADLNGGDLVFTNAAGDVETLSEVGGYYVLSRTQLIVSSGSLLFPDGSAIADGTLTFTPALNTSDAIPTQIVTLSVQVQVNNSDGSEKVVVENSKDITINSVADLPEWVDDSSTYDYNGGFDDSIVEDGSPIMINLTADLVDKDSSEQLTYRIENIDENLTLMLNDGSATPVEELNVLTQAQLNTLQATSPENFAGKLTFDVIAIATENDNNDTIEHEAKLITINVQPVADPVSNFTVKKVNSVEDSPINLSGVINASLTDLDGSETLSYEIRLPNNDWSINSLGGASITDLGGNVWSVLAADVENSLIEIIPQQDISAFTLGPDNPDGTFDIGVKAISTESVADGVPVSGSAFETPEKMFTVYLAGLVDQPSVDTGTNWQYDGSTFTISNITSFDEDQDIPLDFLIQSGDIDDSEEINLLITSLPDNLIFVDDLGNTVNLDVVEVINNAPVYAVSASDLQSLSVRATEDFSGLAQVELAMIVSDPLGNTERFKLHLDLTLSPVIDESEKSMLTKVEGIEDQVTILDLTPPLDADIDSSEIITGAVITSLFKGSKLVLDGEEYDFTRTLDLSTLVDSFSPDLESLLASGRLGLLAPQDASGRFNVAIDYTVVDTSSEGNSPERTISTKVEVLVKADVDITTVLNSTSGILTSDGSAIDLTGKVNFTEGDSDGSETLQYIVLVMPDITGWYVSHPNGALPDGDGNWRIPINSTSGSVVEEQLDLLAGVTIVSENPTDGPVTINVAGRVLDDVDIYIDKGVILTSFEVRFTAGSNESKASSVSTLQNSIIDAVEDERIDTSGHLNTNIGGDSNDMISFRVLAADLPRWVTLSGPGVQVIHHNDGFTRKEYVFNEDALSTLTISSAGENFAGILDIPVRIIASDTTSGDTLIDDSQIITIDVTPVVDGTTAETTDDFIYEDSTAAINLSFTLIDDHLSSTSGGIENIVTGSDTSKNISVTLSSGTMLVDPTGLFQLQSGSTWLFTGTSLSELQNTISKLGVNPGQHISGEEVIIMEFAGYVEDRAVISSGEVIDEQPFRSSIVLSVEAVTDFADLTAPYIEGAEDTAIDLSSLAANLIDQDGSEYISLTLLGVPEGASVGYNNGTDIALLANNGNDGGSFNGQPTYSWSIGTQLANLVFTPPANYAGDINLTLQAITKDQEPGVFVTSESNFILGVLPVADGLDFYLEPENNYIGNENDQIDLDIGAVNLDLVGSERIQVKVTIHDNSDQTALYNIDNNATITVGGNTAVFLSNAEGGFEASIVINASEIDSLAFYPGGQAFGRFDMDVSLSTLDIAVVNGNRVFDTSSEQTTVFEIDLAPEPDAPLWVSADDLTVNTGNNVALNLDIEERNPAENEKSYIEILSFPPGATFNKGSANGDNWLVDEADLAGLEVSGLAEGEVSSLILRTFAELDGVIKAGVVEIINITVTSSLAPVAGSFMLPQKSVVSRAAEDTLAEKIQAVLNEQDNKLTDTFAKNIESNGSDANIVNNVDLITAVHPSEY